MALALLFEDDSVLFLDAVTLYSKSKSSSISNHPVDASRSIVDHVSKDNPVFTLRAVISAADFHTTYTRPADLLEGDNVIDTEFNQPVEGAVITAPSQLLDYLPGSIRQFLGSQDNSNVSVDTFRGYSHEVARDRLNAAWDKSELITILDYNFDISTGRSVSVRSIQNCLMSRLEDVEDVDTGDALTFTATFNQVRFAFLKEVDVQITQQVPSSEVEDESAGESDKGDQTSQGSRRVVEDIADFIFEDIGLIGTGELL